MGRDSSTLLVCTVCGKEFERAKTGAPAKTCSKRCRSRAYYLANKQQLHQPRTFLTPEQRKEHQVRWWKTAYENRKRDPVRWSKYLAQIRARNPLRREYWRNRWRQANFYGVELPTPYVGHMWMDKIRAMAGPMPDQTAPWADKYNDIVGEGVLALLEGRDPQAAMDKFRKQENFAEYNFKYISDIESDERTYNWWMGRLPRPEIDTGGTIDLDEVSEAPEPSQRLSGPIVYERKVPMNWKKNKARRLHAANRKGSRGPKRSFIRFRGRHGDHKERKYYG